MPGSVTAGEGHAIISEANPDGSYGGIASPTFKLDFSRKPVAVVDVEAVKSKWTLQLHVKGEKWGFYVKPDGPETGHFVIDVMKEMHKMQPDLAYLGQQDVEVWLIAAGVDGADVTVKRIDMFYQDEPDQKMSKWEGKRTADQWLDWKPIDSMAGSVIVDKGQATVREENILNRGGIASPFMDVDFSRNPTIALDLVDAKKDWSLLLYFEGAQEGYVIEQPSSSLGKQSFQIRSLMEQAYPNVNVQGVHKLQVWIVAEGEDKAAVTVRDLVLAYETSSDSWKTATRIAVAAAGCVAVAAGALFYYRRKRKNP